MPKSADEYFALSDRARDTMEQTTRLVSRMREEGVSLRRAARDAKIAPKTAIRLAGSALRKLPNGRYTVARSDRLLRVLVIPDEKGLREIALRSSREASKVSHYFTALRRYLQTGDAFSLNTFYATVITLADGSRVPLLTDVSTLNQLAHAGVLSFESIYARTS